MHETGTGSCVGAISHLFSITAACFSDTGVYLVLGSKTGHIGVWTVSQAFGENIAEVLEQMRVNPKFWNDYPIMAPEEGQYESEESSDSEITIDNGKLAVDHKSSGSNPKGQYSNKPSRIRVGNKFLPVDSQSNARKVEKDKESQR
jgi:hypothetical protein